MSVPDIDHTITGEDIQLVETEPEPYNTAPFSSAGISVKENPKNIVSFFLFSTDVHE